MGHAYHGKSFESLVPSEMEELGLRCVICRSAVVSIVVVAHESKYSEPAAWLGYCCEYKNKI
jgi:hypothetical protein